MKGDRVEAVVDTGQGTQTFELVGISTFKPGDRSGQKIQAKGLLYKSPEKARLNLSSFQVVASSCAS